MSIPRNHQRSFRFEHRLRRQLLFGVCGRREGRWWLTRRSRNLDSMGEIMILSSRERLATGERLFTFVRRRSRGIKPASDGLLSLGSLSPEPSIHIEVITNCTYGYSPRCKSHLPRRGKPPLTGGETISPMWRFWDEISAEVSRSKIPKSSRRRSDGAGWSWDRDAVIT